MTCSSGSLPQAFVLWEQTAQAQVPDILVSEENDNHYQKTVPRQLFCLTNFIRNTSGNVEWFICNCWRVENSLITWIYSFSCSKKRFEKKLVYLYPFICRCGIFLSKLSSGLWIAKDLTVEGNHIMKVLQQKSNGIFLQLHFEVSSLRCFFSVDKLSKPWKTLN